jgi:hypothetical protein
VLFDFEFLVAHGTFTGDLKGVETVEQLELLNGPELWRY